MAVGLVLWVPILPFSGVLATWIRRIFEPLFGLSSGLAYDGLLAAFLPMIGAAILAVLLIAFCKRCRSVAALQSLAWGAAASWLFLGAMAIVGKVTALGASWAWAEITASSVSGVFLAVLGVRLRRQSSLPGERRLGLAFVLAGVGVGTFFRWASSSS